MRELLDRVLQSSPGDVWVLVLDVLRNPTMNLMAFVLILTAITIVVLLLIVFLLIVFGFSSEDDAYLEQGEPEPSLTPDSRDEHHDANTARLAGVDDSATGRSDRGADVQGRQAAADGPGVVRLIGPALFVLAVAVVWIMGGWISSADRLCMSCHATGSMHRALVDGTPQDPHSSVACVSCHESPSSVVVVTTSVPIRAVHFVAGMVAPRWASDYGAPVADSACARCHQELINSTYEDTDRGIKVSHVEPIEAGARCVDCHVPQAKTGIIGSITVGMDPCMRCHDAVTAPVECGYCHTKDVGSAVASRGVVKAVSHLATLDCGGCHSQETCDTCHGVRMPHTTGFIAGGHAREAVEDIWFNEGKVCKRCHSDTRNPCTRCHNASFPQHASPGMAIEHTFADPYNNGCDQCHDTLAWDAQRNYCGLCHEKYAKGMKFE